MITVAIDTASAVSSVALIDDGVVIAADTQHDVRRHAETLAPMLQALLQDVDRSAVTNIACGVGPGPYTGVRAGVASAQALGLALDVEVIGLCSLDALADIVRADVPVDGSFTVAIDAKRREWYWARYVADGTRIDGPHIALADSIEAYGPPTWLPHAAAVGQRVQRLLVAGHRMSSIQVGLSEHGFDDGATARSLADVALLPPRPLYVRRPDVTA